MYGPVTQLRPPAPAKLWQYFSEGGLAKVCRANINFPGASNGLIVELFFDNDYHQVIDTSCHFVTLVDECFRSDYA